MTVLLRLDKERSKNPFIISDKKNFSIRKQKYYYICLIFFAIVLNLIFPEIMDYKFINLEYLNSVSGGDNEFISELVVLFKNQAVEMYKEMKIHLSGNNYTLLGFLAHKAKSSVSIMGMTDLAQMLKTFEYQAKEGKDSELYESYILRFKTETEGAIAELEDLVSNRLNKC